MSLLIQLGICSQAILGDYIVPFGCSNRPAKPLSRQTRAKWGPFLGQRGRMKDLRMAGRFKTICDYKAPGANQVQALHRQ
jgi:hypothetical protein